MVVFRGVGLSIVVLGLCLLILNKAKGEEERENSGNRVWNFFFGGKETPTYNCPVEPVTRETRNRSVAYVRWGRNACNSDTSDTVYSGYVGGGNHLHKGAGTNSLCLPDSPEYDDDLIASSNLRSLLYGAEYHTNNYSPFSDVHNTDIVCAVCLANGKSTTLMIPAKLTCPSGWTKEYGGVLMGSYYNDFGASDYFCVDRNPQGRTGSSANNNGQLFYATEGRCGSLPCPPYVDGNELSCVVCSR